MNTDHRPVRYPLAPSPRPGRVLVVFSRAADARDVSGWLTTALDMDLTVARDFRVAQSLLLAAGAGRYRAVICDASLRGGTGLELLSRAKSLDTNVTTVLVSRFPTEALDMHEMFFVDHHVPAGLAGEQFCGEVLRALGMSPGVARALGPRRGVFDPPVSDGLAGPHRPQPAGSHRSRLAGEADPWGELDLPAAMPMMPDPWPFGRTRERELTPTPVPPRMGPVTWGNELESGLFSAIDHRLRPAGLRAIAPRRGGA